jgi:hypothetical protein
VPAGVFPAHSPSADVIAVSIFNVFLLALELVGGGRDEWISCVTLG